MTYYNSDSDTTKPPKHPGDTTNHSAPNTAQKINHSIAVSSEASYFRAYREKILSGDLPLPAHLVIGADCKRGHGFNGKMLRTALGGACICCVQFKQRKPEEVRHKAARDIAEDKQIARELWLDKEIGEDYPD